MLIDQGLGVGGISTQFDRVARAKPRDAARVLDRHQQTLAYAVGLEKTG